MNEKSVNALDSLEPYVLCAALINLDNAANNYKKISSIIGNATCSAVVKADAYGLGASKIAPVLEAKGCNEFFVATIEEGIEIRRILNEKAKIFILGGVLKNTEEYFLKYNLIPVLVNDEQLCIWHSYSQKLGKKLPCILHVDTGIIRNGFSTTQMKEISKSDAINSFDIIYIISHLACSDSPNHYLNHQQLSRFNDTCSYYPGIKRSISSTCGTFLGNEYICDMVRIGKGIYGFAIRDDLVDTLYPVVEIYAKILQINEVLPGQSVGYGATFTAEHPMKLITVGMGYADGMMRKFSGSGVAYINNQKIPMVGRVSMDYSVFDISNINANQIKIGDWVSFANDVVSLEKFSLNNGTLPHEITCKLGTRVKKIYI